MIHSGLACYQMSGPRFPFHLAFVHLHAGSHILKGSCSSSCLTKVYNITDSTVFGTPFTSRKFVQSSGGEQVCQRPAKVTYSSSPRAIASCPLALCFTSLPCFSAVFYTRLGNIITKLYKQKLAKKKNKNLLRLHKPDAGFVGRIFAYPSQICLIRSTV
ncbi:unnamed protein product [Protopolystoma xenopodis]|uniref:Uncharacterized protein n=1 Tax=Protopolystoma xenopodis TaxID=117903 RepID=A0A448XBC8_9PLAT|nr:unnamed protein product [Protopolystoma xenopodis]